MGVRWGGLLSALLLTACGDSDGVGGEGIGGAGGSETGGAPGCEAPSIALADGSCISPGVQPDGCPAGTWAEEGTDGPCRDAGVQANGCDAGSLMVDGDCVPAGVPPQGCAEGFESDGARGCNAVLPSMPCGYGQMAIMGETSCRPVAPCAAGTYGDIPTDIETEFVDGSFVGVSDGSELSPWTQIQDAIDAASPGDVVAIAEGVYAEDLFFDKPVRLWGRCPELVELAGAGGPATVTLRQASQGTELRDLAVTGVGIGIDLAGASDILLDRVWVHDTGNWGIAGVDGPPMTSLTMTRSLVELTYDTAVRLYGTDATIEESVVRDTFPTPTGLGLGITVQEDEGAGFRRPRMTLRNSLVERNAEVGVSVYGAEAELHGVYIRDTATRESGKFGRGLGMQPGTQPDTGAVVTVTGSIIENSYDSGAFVTGSTLTLEHTVIRDSFADGLDRRGYAVGIQFDPFAELPSQVEMTQCLFERSTEIGIVLASSDVKLHGVLVRDTRPSSSGSFGRGMSVQTQPPVTLEGADVEVVGSSVEDNFEVGLFMEGGRLHLEGVNVSGTQVGAQILQGFGLAAQDEPISGQRPAITMRGCRFSENHSVGIFAGGCDLDVQGTLVESTQPTNDGNGPLFGRGASIQVGVTGAAASTHLRGSRFRNNAEAGIFFAGGEAVLEGVVVADTVASRGLSRGINVQADALTGLSAVAEVRWSVIEGGHEAGILATGADVLLDSCIVRDVKSRDDGAFGDGFGIVNSPLPTSATILRSLLEGNQRAGLANFGASMHLEESVVRCNALDLVGEEWVQPYVYEDAGGNACGCDDAVPCRVLSSNLSPPDPLVEATQ